RSDLVPRLVGDLLRHDEGAQRSADAFESPQFFGLGCFGCVIDLPKVIASRKSRSVLTALPSAERAQDTPVVPLQELRKFLPNGARESTTRENLPHCLLKVMVESHSCFMKVHLSKHRVACQHEPFGRVHPALAHS